MTNRQVFRPLTVASHQSSDRRKTSRLQSNCVTVMIALATLPLVYYRDTVAIPVFD